MEQRIKNRFNDNIFDEIIKRFGVQKNQIKSLDSFESYIYEFTSNSKDFILRISHSIRRNENLIHAEVDWINYLADRGVGVSKAITSTNGKLVEAVDDLKGGQFLASAFIKAEGKSPWGLWTPEQYESYGEIIGKMHFHTKQYQPTQPGRKRPEWDDLIFDFVNSYLGEHEWLVKEKYKQVLNQVNQIPKNQQTYGLIHQDAHGGNLFIDDEGQITLFDFDDCCYSWFINDIAIVLFYIVMDAKNRNEFTKEFLRHFFKGYLKHCSLDPEILKEIPNFLKLREIELYAAILRDFGPDNIEDEWCDRYMKGRKDKINNEIPYIDLNFDALKTSL